MAVSIESLCDRLLAGDRAALSQALSLVEQGSGDYLTIRRHIRHAVEGKVVLGVTGPPGAGKSSLVNVLTQEWRARGYRVAIIAVDPSSPISGGALLGDRVRMSAALDDDGVFVRSLSSSGTVGGLAPAVVRLLELFDAAGFDRLIIETVGAGQSEIDVAAVADIKLVVSAPGLGDGIQAIKSGLLEIADVLVVNKSDLPGADATAEQLRNAVSLRGYEDGFVPVVLTSASSTAGIIELADVADELLVLRSSHSREERMRQRLLYMIEQAAKELLNQKLHQAESSTKVSSIVNALAAGDIDPRTAALEIMRDTLAESECLND
ncbi:MAG: methylmalonyl Co-A mutase-associated GTPase MeaB [Pseudomonadota bacterium]